MTKKIVTLSKVSSISRIINVLKVTTHNYFPVVSDFNEIFSKYF